MDNLNFKYIENKKRISYTSSKEIEYAGQRRMVPVIKFSPLDSLSWIDGGFSTRLGGESTGIYESMNLSFSRGDEESKVSANHKIMANFFKVEPDNCVYSYQTHTTNVIRITDKHRGMGIVKERDFGEVDGFVTNEPGILLITSYADCVPLYFVDPVKKAIGLSHSGWRGTVANMAKATIDKMVEEFGTNPEDVVGIIGPSICKTCYEVGEDVASQFAGFKNDVVTDKETLPDGTKKYYLDLHEANRQNFLSCGIKNENIYLTDICTCDNPNLIFSHRASKGKRGGACGYLMIKN